MKTSKSILEKMHAAGVWIGPKAFLKNKLKFAYQLTNNKAFIGVFEKDAFKEYPQFDSGNTTLYLGKPSELFQPVPGRDKIRDENGKLKIIKSVLPPKRKTEPIDVKPKDVPECIPLFPLNWSQQDFDHGSFDGFNVQISGVGIVGLPIAVMLMKMGVKNPVIYDPLIVAEADLALSFYRTFDPGRPRGQVAFEIIHGQTLRKPEVHLEYLTENIGNLVINTLDDPKVRQVIWKNMVGKSGLLLDVQLNGSSGKLFAINPADQNSAELYEESLNNPPSSEKSDIAMVMAMAGVTASAFSRYILSPANERPTCLNRLYQFNRRSFFRDDSIEAV